MKRKIILAAILSLAAQRAAQGAAAQTGYQVQTYSETYIEASGADFAVGYNLAGNLGLNAVNVDGVGYHTYGGGNGASGGGSPTDTVGNATSSANSSTAQSQISPFLNAPLVTVNASASAKASLASGSIGVAGSGDYLTTAQAGSGQGGGTGHAYAAIGDTLTFTVPGATASTVTNIAATFTVEGGFSIPTAQGDSNGSLTPVLGVNGSASFQQTVASGPQNQYVPTLSAATVGGWVSSGFSSDTPNLIIFNGVFSVTGAAPVITFSESLSGSGSLGTGIGYYNTGFLTINPPTGVTYTSASGVFDTVPVPEPASGALIVGLMSAACLRRKRNRRA